MNWNTLPNTNLLLRKWRCSIITTILFRYFIYIDEFSTFGILVSIIFNTQDTEFKDHQLSLENNADRYFQVWHSQKPQTGRIKRNAELIKGGPRLSVKSIVHSLVHDDVIKWKHFPRCWPFVREIHRSPVNSPHKGQWRGALMFCLICTWINGWVNNREAGNLRLHRPSLPCERVMMHHVMTLGYGYLFPINGLLWSYWWLPLTKSQWCGALMFNFICYLAWVVQQTVEWLVIWDATALMWRQGIEK